MKEYLLPHFNDRKTKIDMLVLHTTAHEGAEAAECLDRLGLSAHYLLTCSGELIRLVADDHRAWHAGMGFWRGTAADLNSHSVGIEICSPSLGQTALAEAQFEALVPLCQRLIRDYDIAAVNVVGHSDIAPLRKADPGPAFPWQRLSEEGIGVWYKPEDADKMTVGTPEEWLKIIGYDTRTSEAVCASAYAFCRHFAPAYVAADSDIRHLVEHVLPADFAFMEEDGFQRILRATAYAYQRLSQSNAPCKI